MSYSEIQFYGVMDRNIIDDSDNVTMLVVPRPFRVSKRLRKIGTVMKCHEISDDVMITLQRKSKFQTWYVALRQQIMTSIICLASLTDHFVYSSSYSSYLPGLLPLLLFAEKLAMV